MNLKEQLKLDFHTLIKDASKTMEKKEPKGFIYNSKNKIKFKLK